METKRIDDIWKEYIQNPEELNPEDRIIIDRGYHIEKELPKGGILFLGMNPSYSEGDKSYINNEKDIYGSTYILKDIKDVSLGLREQREDEKINKQYWKPIVDAAVRIMQENTGRKKEDIEHELEFCHHDLFFVRETDQKKVLSLRAKSKYKDFFAEQLKYTIDLIEAAAPKIIIVINAGAGNLIRGELKTDFFGFKPGTKNDVGSWNEECGVDIIKIGERKVPIIFTGMLSSTGRINKGTETTLFWKTNQTSLDVNKQMYYSIQSQK